MKNNYVFTFRGIIFDTDEGTGEDDPIVAHLLNSKYGNSVFQIRAVSQEAALTEAISLITSQSGFRIVDADYEIKIT